jgi:hypothetical protein
MVNTWYIYHVENCQYTTPVKNKYIAIVCFNPNPHGFIINSKISPFIQKRPELLACQVPISVEKYGFLGHDSYINCSNILSFKESQLKSIQKIQNNTRNDIKKVVSTTKLIAPIYKKLICGETDS